MVARHGTPAAQLLHPAHQSQFSLPRGHEPRRSLASSLPRAGESPAEVGAHDLLVGQAAPKRAVHVEHLPEQLLGLSAKRAAANRAICRTLRCGSAQYHGGRGDHRGARDGRSVGAGTSCRVGSGRSGGGSCVDHRSQDGLCAVCGDAQLVPKGVGAGRRGLLRRMGAREGRCMHALAQRRRGAHPPSKSASNLHDGSVKS